MKRKPKTPDKKPQPAPAREYSCAGCEGRDKVIDALNAHIRSLERQVEIVANLADPMVQARVAAAKGELAVPVLASGAQIAAAMMSKTPNNPRRWREEDSAGPAKSSKPGKPDTPSEALDPEDEFERALQKTREQPETDATRPS